MEAKEIFALDVGTEHTGIARASSIARLAEPFASIKTADVLVTIRELVQDRNVRVFVVGLPRNMQGESTKQTAWVKGWLSKVKPQVEAIFYWQDEALTSKLAKDSIDKKNDEHSLAATIILQDFLDADEAERVEA